MIRHHWPTPPTMSTRVRVSQLVHEYGRHGRPDRPNKTDALAHLADADVTAYPAPSSDPAEAQLLARMLTAIDALPERTRTVLDARLDGLTLAEVGAIVGLSRERVRQIEREAHLCIRGRLRVGEAA